MPKKTDLSSFKDYKPPLSYKPRRLTDGVEGYAKPADAALFGLMEKTAAKRVQLSEMATADGLVEPGNIDLLSRPTVKNEDGSISTVKSMSANFDGREYLIPMVAEDGSGILTEDAAIDQFLQTKKHLGVFNSPEAATEYAERLHEQQSDYYSNPPQQQKRVMQPFDEFWEAEKQRMIDEIMQKRNPKKVPL